MAGTNTITTVKWDALRHSIADAIEAAGRTRGEVAAAAQVATGSLSQFLSGTSQTLTLDALIRLAETLSLDLGKMLGLAGAGTATVPLAALRAHPRNPRASIGDVTDLMESIARRGVLVPLIVYPAGEGSDYIVRAGNRRLVALSSIWSEGSHPDDPVQIDGDYPVPVIVAEPMPEADELIDQLIENLAREAMHPLDEGVAFRRLQDARLGTAEIAARVGVTQRMVQSRISLTRRLTDTAMDLFREGALHLAHAEAMAHYGPEIQDALLHRRYNLTDLTEKETRAALDEIASELAGPTGDEPDQAPDPRHKPAGPALAPVEVAQPYRLPAEGQGPAPLTTTIKAGQDAPAEYTDGDGAGMDDDDEGNLGADIAATEWVPDDRLPEAERGYEIDMHVTHVDPKTAAMIVFDGCGRISARFVIDGQWRNHE